MGGIKLGKKFGKALGAMQDGNKVARQCWEGMWLEIQQPDQDSKMSLPYIYMSTVGSETVPWAPSQEDILADDWIGIKINK